MSPTVLLECGVVLQLSEVTKHETKRKRKSFDLDFDLFVPMRHFIRFGTLTGIIPLAIIGKATAFRSFRWISWPAIASIFAITLLTANTIIVFLSLFDKIRSFELSKTHHLVEFVGASMLNFHSLYTYIHFMRNAKVLRNLTNKWRSTCSKLLLKNSNEFENTTKSFSRQAGLIGVGCMVSIILENAFYHLKLFPICVPPDDIILQNRGLISSWEYYYIHGQAGFIKLGIPYNPILTFLLFLGNKILIYTTTYCDIFIILMAKAVHIKYKILVSETRLRIKSFYWKNQTIWPIVYEDYINLTELVNEIEKFLSPMVFMSFTRSVSFLLTLIQQGLAFHENVCWWYEPIYRSWLVIHFFTLLFLLCHFSAQITDEQENLRKLLDRDLSAFSQKQVRRLEYFLWKPPTFTGLGYFRTVRPFIISIANAILTFEVLILQTSTYSELNVSSHSIIFTTTPTNSSFN